jgi:hypothetical protein
MAAWQIKRAVQANPQFFPTGSAERSAENFFRAGRGAAKMTLHIFILTQNSAARKASLKGIFTAKSKK